jgi:hypothetical protein
MSNSTSMKTVHVLLVLLSDMLTLHLRPSIYFFQELWIISIQIIVEMKLLKFQTLPKTNTKTMICRI